VTIRIGLIGNSHLSALALAWRTLAARHPDVELTFLGARAYRCEGLRVTPTGLRPDNEQLRRSLIWLSNGRDEIAAADYDAFWFAGHDFGFYPVLDTYADCWAEAHKPDPARTPVSDALFAELCDAALRRTLSMELYRRLRQVSDAPVSMLCQPAPLGAARRSHDPRFRGFGVVQRQDEAELVRNQAEAALARIERAEGITIFRQPPETLTLPLHSHRSFSLGSVRLDKGLSNEHPRGDIMHMNADYGALALAPALATVSAFAADREGGRDASDPGKDRQMTRDQERADERIVVEGAGRT
jgi:hypothetical protein